MSRDAPPPDRRRKRSLDVVDIGPALGVGDGQDVSIELVVDEGGRRGTVALNFASPLFGTMLLQLVAQARAARWERLRRDPGDDDAGTAVATLYAPVIRCVEGIPAHGEGAAPILLQVDTFDGRILSFYLGFMPTALADIAAIARRELSGGAAQQEEASQ